MKNYRYIGDINALAHNSPLHRHAQKDALAHTQQASTQHTPAHVYTSVAAG